MDNEYIEYLNNVPIELYNDKPMKWIFEKYLEKIKRSPFDNPLDLLKNSIMERVFMFLCLI